MNFYEHTLIARQDVSPSQIKQIQEKYTKIIESNNGNILKFDINKNRPKIVKLYGNDANSGISELNNLFLKKEKILNSINSIFFQRKIGWKIIFKNNKCVLLPLKKIAAFPIFLPRA